MTNISKTKMCGGGDVYNMGGVPAGSRNVPSIPPPLNNNSFCPGPGKNKHNILIMSDKSKSDGTNSILHNINYRKNGRD